MEDLKKEFMENITEENNYISYEEEKVIEKEIEDLKEQILSGVLNEKQMQFAQEKISIRENKIEEKKRFQVENINQANWCLGMIKHYKNKIEQIEEFKKIEKAKLDTFAKNKIENCDRNIEHFTYLLKDYIDREREIDPKFSISTINGTVNYGKETSKIVYDENIMAQFCKENGYEDALKITLSKSAFNKMIEIMEDKVVTNDGLIVEDATIEKSKKLNIRTK